MVDLRKNTYFIFSFLYKIVCGFVPQFKKKVCFISYPDASDNSWHLYRYMVENVSEHVLVWLCSDPEKVQQKIIAADEAGKNKIIVAKKNSLRGIYQFITSGHIFSTHGTYFFVSKGRGPILINLWHGMPIKNIGYLDGKKSHEVCSCDYSLSTSDYYSDIIAKSFGIPKNKVLNFGLPRNDVLRSYDVGLIESVFEALNIDLSLKLIMWLPTYRVSTFGDIRTDSSQSSFIDEWEEDILCILNEYAKAHNCFVLIKLHPMDQMNEWSDSENCERVKIIKSESWQESNLDLYEVLSCSSALITDVSSVLIDYISAEKPIAVTQKSIGSYTRSTIDKVDILFDSFFMIRSIDDFEDFFQRVKYPYVNDDTLSTFNLSDRQDRACSKIEDFFNIH